MDDRAPLRQKINTYEDETIAALIKDNPELQKAVDDSEGYFSGRISGIKIPVFGAGKGIGVLYDKENSSRTYMNIKRLGVPLHECIRHVWKSRWQGTG